MIILFILYYVEWMREKIDRKNLFVIFIDDIYRLVEEI